MTKSLEKKRMRWVKDNVPLLAIHSEDEMRRVVQEAAKDTQMFQLIMGMAVVLATTVVGSWLRGEYINETIEKGELYFWVTVTAGAFGGVTWYLTEQLFRYKVRKLVEAM